LIRHDWAEESKTKIQRVSDIKKGKGHDGLKLACLDAELTGRLINKRGVAQKKGNGQVEVSAIALSRNGAGRPRGGGRKYL